MTVRGTAGSGPGIRMGSGGGSVASLCGEGGSGAEMESSEAGSGVMVPEDSVNPDPGPASATFSFLGLLVFFGVTLVGIIIRGEPGGPAGDGMPAVTRLNNSYLLTTDYHQLSYLSWI